MKNKGMWVFRLSVGEGGNPTGVVVDWCIANRNKIREYRRKVTPLYGDLDEGKYEEDENFLSTLKQELFEHGKLRQSWGYEYEGMKLDLNQPPEEWVENYLNLNWRLWGEKTDCENATGRWNILMRMTNMEIGDVVFIPRIPDESKFTVATIKNKYFFQPMKEYFGHAHVLGVKKVKEYNYENHFLPKEFNPYRNAVNQVGDHHKIYDTLEDFLEKYYL